VGELYASQWAFDWFDKCLRTCAPVDNSVDNLRTIQKSSRKFVETYNAKHPLNAYKCRRSMIDLS
jgi:hypothetical protein